MVFGTSCFVADCYSSRASKHRFPRPDTDLERFEKWVILSGNKRLLERTPNNIYTNCRVCSDHFLPSDFGFNHVLLKTAVPSVKLPDPLEGIKIIRSADGSCIFQYNGTPVGDPSKPGSILFCTTTIDAPEPVENLENAEEDVLLPPFKRIKLGQSTTTSNNDQAESLYEPEIKIEQIPTTEDPLKIANVDTNPPKTGAGSQSSLSRLKVALTGIKLPSTNVPIILTKVALPPKGVILQNINKVAASQSEILKKLNLSPKVAALTKPAPKVAVVTQKKAFTESETVDLTLDEDEIEASIIAKTSPEKKYVINIDGNLVEAPLIEENSAKMSDSAPKITKLVSKPDCLCVVSGCSGSKYFFPFPYNTRALNIWRFCLTDPAPQSGELICDKHFLPEDILETPARGNIFKLKRHVVPTILPIQKGCVMPSCPNKSVNAPNMFPIPIWGRYREWVMIIGNLNYTRTSELLKFRVCELHFKEITEENIWDLVPNENLPLIDRFKSQLQAHMDKTDDRISKKTAKTCAHAKCSREQTDGVMFAKFPQDYTQALGWLAVCARGDILLKQRNGIETFIVESSGVCLEHYKEIYDKMSEVTKSGEKTAAPESEDLDTNIELSANNSTNDSVKVSEPVETYVPVREYCAFVNCTTNIRNSQVKKYRFPSDPQLLKEWISASGVPEFIDRNDLKGLFVCGKHFKGDQYTPWNTLKMNSIPVSYHMYVDPGARDSNNLWLRKKRMTRKKYVIKTLTPETPPKVHERKVTTGTKQKENKPDPWLANYLRPNSPLRCCVEHCQADGDSTVLFEFPRAIMNRLELWVKALKNNAKITEEDFVCFFDRSRRICSKHFEPEYLNKENKLTEDAVPTLDLIDPNETRLDTGPLDTSVVWQEYKTNPADRDHIMGKDSVKGKAILRENSIQFPNLERELKFGEDCPKKGVNKFPYSIHRLTNGNVLMKKSVPENIRVGHKLQVHTAIIIDDDDEAERNALDMIREVVRKNQASMGSRKKDKIKG